MRIAAILVIIFTSFLQSCRVSVESVAGTYVLPASRGTQLVLKDDKTFEFTLDATGAVLPILSGGIAGNFIAAGEWRLEDRSVVLNSHPDTAVHSATSIDSIARFVSISSFSFWNRHHQPIAIRSIVLPPARPKPHFGNSLYFFSQDFKRTDTLKFYFTGYPVFAYPGSIPYSIGNNLHKITLLEPYRHEVFLDTRFLVHGKQLRNAEYQLFFRRKNKAMIN